MSVDEIASVPPEPNEVGIGERTQSLLMSPEWARASDRTCSGLIKRLDMMDKAGLPAMKVIAAEEINRLGRVPRSTDPEARLVNARDVVRADEMGFSRAVFVFLSHQRARDGEPWNDHVGRLRTPMADALVAFAKWLREIWYLNIDDHVCGAMKCFMGCTNNDGGITRNHEDFKIYFWIDMCCADDACLKNEGPFMAALPAYIAACHAIATDWVEEYSPTAKEEHYYSPGDDWRKAELMLAFAFSMKGDRLHLIPRDFDFDFDSNSNSMNVYEQAYQPKPRTWHSSEEFWSLPDPSANVELLDLVETARASKLYTCQASCVRYCSLGDSRYHPPGAGLHYGFCNNWCHDNICCCGQCCGFCAWVSSRNLPPSACTREGSCVSIWNAGCPNLHLAALAGKQEVLVWWADGDRPTAAPQPAVMTRDVPRSGFAGSPGLSAGIPGLSAGRAGLAAPEQAVMTRDVKLKMEKWELPAKTLDWGGETLGQGSFGEVIVVAHPGFGKMAAKRLFNHGLPRTEVEKRL